MIAALYVEPGGAGEVVAAAEAFADWYRAGGNPETERYRWLAHAIVHAVDTLHQATSHHCQPPEGSAWIGSEWRCRCGRTYRCHLHDGPPNLRTEWMETA